MIVATMTSGHEPIGMPRHPRVEASDHRRLANGDGNKERRERSPPWDGVSRKQAPHVLVGAPLI